MSEANLNKLKLVELKELLQFLKVSSSGNKAELIQKLESALNDNPLNDIVIEVFGDERGSEIINRISPESRRSNSDTEQHIDEEADNSTDNAQREHGGQIKRTTIQQEDRMSESRMSRHSSGKSDKNSRSSASSSTSDAKLILRAKLAAERARSIATKELNEFKRRSRESARKREEEALREEAEAALRQTQVVQMMEAELEVLNENDEQERGTSNMEEGGVLATGRNEMGRSEIPEQFTIGKRRPQDRSASRIQHSRSESTEKRTEEAYKKREKSELLKDASGDELMKQFMAFNLKSQLPKYEVTKFTGEVGRYQLFRSAFKTSIDSKLLTNREKLNYLHQHTEGTPRKLVEACIYMESSEGYSAA